jgi:hypothetical protein
LNRFTEINLDEYSHLQEAERQKQVLDERMELRERQIEEASARKVATVASERDEAKQQVLQLRKDRLLELAFSRAGAATVIRGSATRSPRHWARAARSCVSSDGTKLAPEPHIEPLGGRQAHAAAQNQKGAV